VFATSRTPDLTVTVFSPTDTLLNSGLPLYNTSASSVNIQSIELLSPSGKAVYAISFRAYTGRRLFIPIATQGTCPENYQPRPVTDVVVKPHSYSRWVVVVSFKLSQPGRYKLGVMKISYETAGHSGWQFYYLGITIDASPATQIPEYVQHQHCPAIISHSHR
jgi:hypothetical protein